MGGKWLYNTATFYWSGCTKPGKWTEPFSPHSQFSPTEKWLYSRISPRKNGYVVGFPPEKWLYSRIPSPPKEWLQWLYQARKMNSHVFTVVKELRSKMFSQHPGYFKVVFLKKTDDYRQFLWIYCIYNVLNYDALWLLLLLITFFVQISFIFL
jgi:hypothetical protein